MEPRRVLLVDDEPQIVASLQRLLRPHREKWSISTATSGAHALALMEANPFDVVVSDMRMPEMDGAALLTIAREKYPAMMRIILSGQTDTAAARRVFAVAHQFLAKPTQSDALLETFQRIARVRAEIASPAVVAALGSLDALPALPAICHELSEILETDDASTEDVAALVESEPAIVAKVLQIVNSAFFGSRRPIVHVRDAVVYLGVEQLRSLVLAIAIGSSLHPCAARFNATAFHDHSLAMGRMTRHVAAPDPIIDASFTFGILHDVGKLVMATTMPDLYDAIIAATERGATFEDVELELGSCGHARLGACLLDVWGLPFPIVSAVLEQLAPTGTRCAGADAIAFAHRLVEPRDGDTFDGPGDDAFLRRMGGRDRVLSLRASGT